jgi:hypothetical protein
MPRKTSRTRPTESLPTLSRRLRLSTAAIRETFTHALLGQVRLSRKEQNIPHFPCATQVRGQGARDHRSDAAVIEYVVLNDDVRPCVPW